MRKESTPRRPRRNYARWRALSLSLVYVVFGIHIAHWRITGKTLAPLELNEVMYTLELGIITAGFLFMCLLVVGTMLFGRFFCSWACHIMVLQDLCAWILRRFGIRNKPVRSRLLLLVPPLTAFYMFLWPQILRAWESRSFPSFHFGTDASGWASFATNNFWRNLPGPWVIAATFLICGFVIVYVLGSRTFCTYVCPYGAVFALADRISPGRIRLAGECRQCATCTAACTCGIRVHEELDRHEMVVNPACLKCLDCVSACPNGVLGYGLARPAFFRSRSAGGRFGGHYDLSFAEELLAAVVFLAGLLTFRGLYSRIPFLLALAIGTLLAYLSVLTLRLALSPTVSLSTIRLKVGGRIARAGRVFAATVSVVFVLFGHSAFVRLHEYSGLRGADALRGPADASNRVPVAETAFHHLMVSDRWGLIANERVERGLTIAAATLKRFDDADRYAARFLRRHPEDVEIRTLMVGTLLERKQHDGVEVHMRVMAEQADANSNANPAHAARMYQALAELHFRRGDFPAAVEMLSRAVEVSENQAELHAAMGSALAELGRFEEAIASLRRAIRLDPNSAGANYNLGTLLGMQGRFDEAVPHYERALPELADDADLHNNFGFALLRLGRTGEAEAHLRQALAARPDHAAAHFNLAAILESRGNTEEAGLHRSAAASLDRNYAAFLGAP